MMHPAYAARQRDRWLRCDAHRWVRPDAAKFLKPGTDPADVYPALARQRDRARQAHDRAFADALAQERIVLDGLRRELDEIKSVLAARALARAQVKYSPSQPRVPSGRTGGGQWTSGSGGRPRVIIDTTDLGNEGEAGDGAFDGGEDFLGDGPDNNPGFDGSGDSFDSSDGSPSSGFDSIRDRAPATRQPTGVTDTRVMSDADPDVVKPGQRYAQVGRRGGPRSDISAAQAARLSVAQGRANDAINRAREIDPTWNPRPSFESTIDGRINRYEAEAREAQQRIDQLSGIIGGGNSVGRSIANPQGRGLSAAEQRQLNEIMAETGCHRCGNIVPGTRSGNAIPDHQPPTALIFPGQSQRLFPHCATCSSAQGGFVSGILKRLR